MRNPFRRTPRFSVTADLMERYLVLLKEAARIPGPAGEGAIEIVRRCYEDFALYADIGKDRKKLGPEWGEKMEEHVRKLVPQMRGADA